MAKPLVEVAIAADGSVFVREVNKAADASAKLGTSVRESGAKAKAAQKDVDSFGETATRAAKYMAAAGAAAVAGAAYFVKSAINQADAAGILAGKLGITTEALTRLEYAAKLSDVSQGSLEAGLKKLSVTLTAAQDPASKAAKALAAIGVSASEIIKLPADQQLGRIGDALNTVENASQRAALAQKIFGKSGVDLLPILQQGSAGIRTLGDEAQRLGVVISGDTAAKAGLFNDQLDKLTSAAQGLGLSIAGELLGPMNELSGELVELAQDKQTAEGIATFVRGIGEAVVWTASAIAKTGNAFRYLGEELAAALNGPAVGDLDRLKRSLKDYQDQLDVYQARVNRGFQLSQQEALEVGRLSTEINKLNGFIRATVQLDEDRARAQKSVADAQKKTNELTEIDLKTLPKKRSSIDNVTAALKSNTGASDSAAKAEEKHQQKIAGSIDQLRFEVEQLGRTERAQRIAVALRNAGADAASKEGQEIAALTGQLFDHEQSVRAAEEATRAHEQAMADAEKQSNPWADALQGAVERVDSAFVDMWKNIGSGFDSFADSLKDAFKQLLAELAHLAITRPIMMRLSAALGLGGGSAGAMAGTGGGLSSLFSSGGSLLQSLKGSGGPGLIGGPTGFATGLYDTMGNLAGRFGFDSLSKASFNQWQNYRFGSGMQNIANAGLNIGASYAGNFAGNAIGQSLFGERKTTGIGGTIGGTIGSAWGPIGSFLGSTLGSIAENAIGKIFGTGDLVKWGKLGVTTGAAPTDGSGLRTVTGASGLSLTAVAKRTDEQSANDLLDAFVALDEGLTTVARGLGVSVDFAGKILGNTNLNVDNEGAIDSFGVGARLDEFSADKIKTAAADFVRAWIKEVSDDLPQRVRTYLDQYGNLDATAEQLVQAFGFIAEIDQLLNLDVVAETSREAEQATQGLLGAYADATAEVLRLADAYDGSLGSLEALTNGLTAQKQVAAQLAGAYNELAGIVEGAFGGTAQMLRESLLTDEQLYDMRRTQIDDALAALSTASDPESIAALVSQIDELVKSAYGFASAENKGAVAEQLIAILDEAGSIAGQRIDSELTRLREQEGGLVDAIDTELLNTAATTQQTSADQQLAAGNLQLEAANINWRAANQFASIAGAFPGIVNTLGAVTKDVSTTVSATTAQTNGIIASFRATLDALNVNARLQEAKP